MELFGIEYRVLLMRRNLLILEVARMARKGGVVGYWVRFGYSAYFAGALCQTTTLPNQ